jgi:hypothetical protein
MLVRGLRAAKTRRPSTPGYDPQHRFAVLNACFYVEYLERVYDRPRVTVAWIILIALNIFQIR